MKILPGIIISAIVLVLAAVVYLTPEQRTSEPLNSDPDNDFGSHIIGEDSPEDHTDAYGSIETDETKTHGYGYISSRQEEITGFGLIEFESRLNDTAIVSSLKSRFSTSDVKVYNNSGILYALINGDHIYIDNKDVTEVKGFNGAINLALVIDTKGVVDSVLYLSSEETSSYMNKLFRAEYFSRYSNLQMDRQHTIDAVVGATITSVATAKAVNEIFTLSREIILKDYLATDTSDFNVVARLSKIWIANLILLFIIFGLVSFRRFRKRKILTIISLVTVVWLGFYLNSSFTWLLFIKPFTTTTLSVFIIAYILLILGSTVWFKNSYCKYICPFGNAQRLMIKISPFKKRSTVFKNSHLAIVRYIITLFVVAGYLSGLEILSEYELFPYLFSVNIHSILFGVSVLMLIISIRIPNLWCRALCPTGCLLDTVSDISENKIKFKFRTHQTI